MKPTKILTVVASSVQQLPLEATSDSTWLSKTVVCQRFTLRGVPAKRVDVLYHPRYNVIQVCEKVGKFDGVKRDQLVLRPLKDVRDLRSADLFWTMIENKIRIDIVSGRDILWSKSYEVLPHKLDAYDPESIVFWHWRRYYSFLNIEIVKSAAQLWVLSEWAENNNTWTLAEANRSASRMLYRLAREEGWRKFTLRERLKNGLPAHSPCWQREAFNEMSNL